MTPSAHRLARLPLLVAVSASAQPSSVFDPLTPTCHAAAASESRGPWMLQGWIGPAIVSTGRVLLAAGGDADGGRFLVLDVALAGV